MNNDKITMRNTKFYVGANVDADNLLFLLENTTVLSQRLSTKIEGYVLGMTTNFLPNQAKAREIIDSVAQDLDCLAVYTDAFVVKIRQMMLDVWTAQILIEKEKK